MVAFHEVRLPPELSYGAKGGPEYRTKVVVTAAGFEFRNQDWNTARGRWDVAHLVKKRAQIDALIAFFRARQGRAYGFRFKDWLDYQVTTTTGYLSGVTGGFQLKKQYSDGSYTVLRTISKPVSGTVQLWNGASEVTSFTLDTTTGIVTGGAGATSWSGQFDVPVRFDTDVMEASVDDYDVYGWQSIPIVEIRL